MCLRQATGIPDFQKIRFQNVVKVVHIRNLDKKYPLSKPFIHLIAKSTE